jgi:bifunctional UDP-N-acetylglucosamine pyrophosphorylase/glucosamine-1-phosphate N-acetyltransferase
MDQQQTNTEAAAAIILAAGKGTRLKTTEPIPKVVLAVAGEPMICWVVRACRQAGVQRCIVVVGYEADTVRQALAEFDDIEFVEQKEQLGTGHATAQAAPLFEGQPTTDVFVLAGDAPLIRPSTLEQLLSKHRNESAAATMATAMLDDPSGYGRIVRDEQGEFEAIVEHKDCTDAQRKICEVNPSYYCFESIKLFDALSRVSNDNNQGEYYLTDVPGLLKQEGDRVALVEAVPAEDVLGVNTTEQQQVANGILGDRIEAKAKAG